MSTDRETTRIVRSWLEDGVTRLPDNVLDAVLDQLPSTHQRRATWWLDSTLGTARGVAPRRWMARPKAEGKLEEGRVGLDRFAPLALSAIAVAILILIGLVIQRPNVGPPTVPTGSSEPSVFVEPSTPTAGAWTTRGSMNEGRDDHTATLLLDGRVLVSGSSTNGTAELYEPSSGSWTLTGSMVEARGGHVAALLPDGRVLVAGGYRAGLGNNGVYLASAEVYDPVTGSWTATEPMVDSHGRGHTITLLPDGRVMVAGGYGDGDTILASAELYDPATGSWTPAASMERARTFHTATLLTDGTVLVAGSVPSEASAEVYEAATDTWTETGSLTSGRHDFTATLLPDGTVLAAGSEGLITAERYDPDSRTWTQTGSLIDPRLGSWTATLLHDGTVLLTGGVLNGGSQSEIYDPGTGSWSPAANTVDRRQYHTATLLTDGSVLVTGGRGNLASAELYEVGE